MRVSPMSQDNRRAASPITRRTFLRNMGLAAAKDLPPSPPQPRTGRHPSSHSPHHPPLLSSRTRRRRGGTSTPIALPPPSLLSSPSAAHPTSVCHPDRSGGTHSLASAFAQRRPSSAVGRARPCQPAVAPENAPTPSWWLAVSRRAGAGLLPVAPHPADLTTSERTPRAPSVVPTEAEGPVHR